METTPDIWIEWLERQLIKAENEHNYFLTHEIINKFDYLVTHYQIDQNVLERASQSYQ